MHYGILEDMHADAQACLRLFAVSKDVVRDAISSFQAMLRRMSFGDSEKQHDLRVVFDEAEAASEKAIEGISDVVFDSRRLRR
jgi:hypothetical protein